MLILFIELSDMGMLNSVRRSDNQQQVANEKVAKIVQIVRVTGR